MTARPSSRPMWFRCVTLLSAAVIASAALAASCAHAPPGASASATASPAKVDSVTVSLWHMDESSLPTVADSGPLRANGVAGLDTRTAFGRFDGARVFTQSVQSFVFIPYVRGFDLPIGFTIEAWVQPRTLSQPGEAPIAARWTPEANMQSWILSIVGQEARPSIATTPPAGSPRYLLPGQIAFSMLPAQAAEPLVYLSARAIEIGRWTHVAVTYDGAVLRFYLDGGLDAQYAIPGAIRSSAAPLVLGNYFDPRSLTDFEGRVRRIGVENEAPYYAFDGSIDDLRLSNVARTEFPNAGR